MRFRFLRDFDDRASPDHGSHPWIEVIRLIHPRTPHPMNTRIKTIRRANLWRLAPLFCAAFVCPITSQASSHSDAPLIKQDPQANLTDLYAFIGTKYDDPSVKVLNVLVSVRPFSEPGDGLIYERFADDALYSIHLTDPATGVVLGGSIVGRHAAELISVIALAVTANLKVSDIVESLLVHPALAEALAEAAE